MTTTKAKAQQPLHTLKVLVMLNALVLLFTLFLVFFTPTLKTETQALPSLVGNELSSNQPVNPPGVPNGLTGDKELASLPYVSATGLQQQATAQVVSYQQQPAVHARSSR